MFDNKYSKWNIEIPSKTSYFMILPGPAMGTALESSKLMNIDL